MSLPLPIELGAPSWDSVPCVPYPKKARTGQGYGYRKEGKKNILAHREAWEKAYGPIPPDKCVCHHCDNRECIEPLHLFLGTATENNWDRHVKGRSRGGRLVGLTNPQAKLTPEQVAEIRALPCIRRCEWKAVEAKYGVGVRHLYAIRAGIERRVAA